ncbi:VOC family protein [Paenibacillus glacialis]|uniref:Glyoxalase n=1 Tax=Paenibacillus glacialis TaxID=494026 RepID=A0A162K574_9BACL|nr:VOC family protein [Paenibacillus glacialis]OAB43176.1 glyoxalase [Paenibacillus glacialis]
MTKQIHPSTQIGLVKLKISDLKRSVAFYKEVVGLRILSQTENIAELTVDGNQPLLILEQIENAVILPERSVAGLYHFAILVPDRISLGLSLRNLIKFNVGVGQGDHLVSEALYINDPDNNGIEIYADRPKESWKRDVNGEYVMTTDPVDVDGLLAISEGKTWSGLSEDTIVGHVHFHVSDLQKTEAFYCGILGFDVTAHYGSMALFISAGGYHHHIGLNTWAGVGAPPAPHDAVGLDYFTLVLPNHEELDHVIVQLKDAGISVRYIDGGWFVKDPSNITIKLLSQG